MTNERNRRIYRFFGSSHDRLVMIESFVFLVPHDKTCQLVRATILIEQSLDIT